jgi:hypothetical protein
MGGKNVGITKWDLFKQIDKMPVEKYNKIKEYLDELNKKQDEEVVLDKETKKNLEKSFDEYSKGEYLTFDEVFEDGENNV